MSRYQGMVRARRQQSRRRRARILFALRADPHPGAARGRARSSAPATTAAQRAGAPAAFCCSSCPSRPSGARQADLDPGDAPRGTEPHTIAEDDAWVEGRSLVATVKDVELIDPALSSERLVYQSVSRARRARLPRRAGTGAVLVLARQNVEDMLKSFSAGRPRPHGRERQDHGDLRVLQFHLRVRA